MSHNLKPQKHKTWTCATHTGSLIPTKTNQEVLQLLQNKTKSAGGLDSGCYANCKKDKTFDRCKSLTQCLSLSSALLQLIKKKKNLVERSLDNN